MFTTRPLTLVAAFLALAIGACAGSTEAGSQEGLAETAVSSTTTTLATTTTSTTEPVTTSDTITVSGVAFASQIESNGRAVDPGIEFPSDVNHLYAVFQSDKLPRGLALDVDEPQDGSYYAFLRPSGDSSVPFFGWRWYYQGQPVVEYEADTSGGLFWLERLDRADTGIFGGDVAITGMGPGQYLVEFTASGNTMFSESFTIAE